MLQITDLLVYLFRRGGSDLHIASGEPPLFRIDGDMTPLDHPKIQSEDCRRMLHQIMNDQQRIEYENHWELDFAIEIKNLARFRVNAFMQRRGPAAVFRVIPSKILTIDDLKLPRVCAEVCHNRQGLILVTGPTGSGKSTTLAAMIDYINKNEQGHIITIEDPIEFVHETQRSLVNQREVGVHTESFSRALKSALREDPDVILVGELRDLETISLALTAAETGHLVLGTLHTNNAPKTIDRIIDVFPSEEQSKVRTQLSESIQAVISQLLLKKRGGGRVAVHEIMIGIPAIRNLIRENKIHQVESLIQTGQKHGMQTLDQGLEKLVAQRMIEPSQAGSGPPKRQRGSLGTIKPLKFDLTPQERKVELIKPTAPPSQRVRPPHQTSEPSHLGMQDAQSMASKSVVSHASMTPSEPAPSIEVNAHSTGFASREGFSNSSMSGVRAAPAAPVARPPTTGSLTPDEEKKIAKFVQFSQQLDNYDYYQLLGVPTTAASDTVRKAYEKRLSIIPFALIKKSPDPHTQQATQKVLDHFVEAYLVLNAPNTKKNYDQLLQGNPKQTRTLDRNNPVFTRMKQKLIKGLLDS